MRVPGKRLSWLSGRSSVLGELVSAHRARVALLATVSFVGALLEAFFLVIITGVAMALVAGEATVGPVLGRSISIGSALVLGLVVLVVRLGLNIVGVRTSARLTADVTSEQRHLLSHAYLEASWSVQQSEPAGRLQELLTSFVQRVNQTMATLTQAITALLSLIAFMGTGLVVDAASTVAVLVALALVGAVLTPLRRRIRRRSELSAHAGLEFANAVSEFGSLGLEMQTFGVQASLRAADRRADPGDDGDAEEGPDAHRIAGSGIHDARLRGGARWCGHPDGGRVRQPCRDRGGHAPDAPLPELRTAARGGHWSDGGQRPVPREHQGNGGEVSGVLGQQRDSHPCRRDAARGLRRGVRLRRRTSGAVGRDVPAHRRRSGGRHRPLRSRQVDPRATVARPPGAIGRLRARRWRGPS